MASTTTRNFTQDMPPKEGYGSIQTERIPLRKVIGGKRALALLVASTVFGHYYYYLDWKRVMRERIELRSSIHAILPIILAEKDRGFLKQLKRNREEEKELMRYYPSWEVGTLFGEKVYEMLPEDEFVEPSYAEFMAHSNPKHMYDKALLRLLT